MLRSSLLPALLLACGASALAGSAMDRALEDLGSPYLEARRRAVSMLVRSGREGLDAMARAYPRADFRTRVLILNGFTAARPEAGIPLLFDDLATGDRGVALAQRRLLSAFYGDIRRAVEARLVPRLEARDWSAGEAVRALPGPGRTPRTTLARLRMAEDPGLRRAARGLKGRISVLDSIRARLSGVAAGREKLRARRAAELIFRLLRHDTERALLAVFVESARDGSYDGMFALVKELRRPEGGPDALDVLFAILRDEPTVEDGVSPDRRKGYDFLEPRPADCDRLAARNLAAGCLGDIGDARTGAELAEYFERLAWNSRPDWQEDEDLRLIDDGSTPKLAVAMACAHLGERRPLLDRVGYLEKLLNGFFSGSPWDRRQLARAYSRLGENEKAARQYEYCLADAPRDAILHYNLACARARGGDLEGCLRALRAAKRYGYGADPSQIAWAWRDGDLAPVRDLPEFRRLFGE